MKFLDLQRMIPTNIFTIQDVEKYFSHEQQHTMRVQLTRFAKQGLITQIKRGFYCLDPRNVNELELANILYIPSYVSLETALHYYGMIPDVTQAVTSVSPITSKRLKNFFGVFHYMKIKQELFWGFNSLAIPQSKRSIVIAKKEKALLDYLYIRNITHINDLRLDLKELDQKLYTQYSKYYPHWVQRIQL